MAINGKTYVAGYVEKNEHIKFKGLASGMNKTVSQLIREIVIAANDNRLKIIPVESNHYTRIYDFQD